MLQRFAIGSSLALVVSLVACSSSSSRTSFDQDATEPSGNGALAGDGTSGSSGSIGGPTEPTPEASDECQKMDIVFIVDDSGSMAEEQANLAHNFPKFVEAINDFKTKSGAKLDWRAAITTTGRTVTYSAMGIPITEKGDNGAFRDKSSCGSTRRWVERSDAQAEQSIACLAEVGTNGPGFEMPLETLKLSLNDRMADGTNAGFLRDDALLAVIILTDEDDCSRTDDNFTIGIEECPNARPVGTYVTMLDAVAHGAGRWATAVIAGETACKSSFGDATAAPRLKEFADLAGKNGTFSSICAGDLTTALKSALDTFDAACKALPPPVK